MKKVCKVVVFLMAISLFQSTECYADNPIVQTNYTADPAPTVYNGTCYLYTTHDEDTIVNNFYTMNDWRCYSSTDMQNWTDHGSPLSYNTFSWAKGDAWAGQVINRNGKFYFYGPMTRNNAGGARVIGVAVSDSPTGPFTDPLGKPLIANNGAQDIDPTVFIDDNGQAYLYWGNGNLYYVKLNQDMISYSGGIVQVSPKPASFIEGPWFYKRNNLYYMVYAGMTGGSENISYATSNSPTGQWTSKGTIMGSQNSYTNHPGVTDYKGNSYLFYHTGNLPGGGSYHRSVGVEQFKYNADGTIPSIPITKNGPGQLGNLDPYIKTEAETICWESGIKTEKCSEGGMDVCNIENGDWIKVKGVDFGSGAASFDARVASAANGGNIELRLDSENGKLVGTCAVSNTGGWQKWITKSCNVSGATGVHDLYLKFTGGSGSLFNFNWWKFTGTGVTPGKTSAFSQIEAESYNTQSGIQTESCSEGGEDVGYIENGDYAVYNNIDFGNGAASFQARVASSTSGGNIEIRLDSLNGTLIGTCPVAGTGGWQTWAAATCNVSGVSGKHDLYLKFTGGSGYLFNLNWFKFGTGLVLTTFITGSNNISISASTESNTTGTFSVLSYNIGGLPEMFSSSGDPKKYIPQIGSKLYAFDLINVQEDFNYHASLYANDTHAYRTPTSGGAGIGDGMNFLSKYPFGDTDRETWTDRYGKFDSGSDELTPKGFMYNQVKIADGVYVDVYNLHADADTDPKSEAARRSNLNQLATYIEQYSQGRAVIVFGDTNCRYTRADDDLKSLFVDRLDMRDVWIEKIRNGIYPEKGGEALLGVSGETSANNEVVDKIFYRSGAGITLNPTSYKVENSYFTDTEGNQLSDHYAISANFSYTRDNSIVYSDLWGGSGGIAFNFLRNPSPTLSRPVSVTIRGENRVDAISMTYADGTVLSNGGTGGTQKTLALENDEYISKAVIYKNTYKGSDRVFYLELTTNKSRVLESGVKSGTALTLTAPAGTYIAGFFGRAEADIDKIGAIYKSK